MATKKFTTTAAPQALRFNEAEWREGQRRVMAMMDELEACSLNETGLNSEADGSDDFRDGRPQANIVFPHLQSLLGCGDSQVLAAFAATLTHFLATALHSGVPFLDGKHGLRKTCRNPFPTMIDSDRAKRFPTADTANEEARP